MELDFPVIRKPAGGFFMTLDTPPLISWNPLLNASPKHCIGSRPAVTQRFRASLIQFFLPLADGGFAHTKFPGYLRLWHISALQQVDSFLSPLSHLFSRQVLRLPYHAPILTNFYESQ